MFFMTGFQGNFEIGKAWCQETGFFQDNMETIRTVRGVFVMLFLVRLITQRSFNETLVWSENFNELPRLWRSYILYKSAQNVNMCM